MDIRPATDTDIPGLLALLRQVGQVHHNIRPDIFRPGCLKYTAADLEKLLRDENFPVFVAMENDAVAGYCFCQKRQYRDSATMTDRLEIYIDDLCVDENCRGSGIATALYRHVCHWAKDTGCAFVTLNVWQGNDAAMAFYEKMGMKPRSITMETELC